jgi:hypothetical protein
VEFELKSGKKLPLNSKQPTKHENTKLGPESAQCVRNHPKQIQGLSSSIKEPWYDFCQKLLSLQSKGFQQ